MTAFTRLLEACRINGLANLSVLYPSSSAVDAPPNGFYEYAMAKAAGETLCAEMNLAWAPLHVTVDRLPRLLTDQTASVTETSRLPSAIACLTPMVREAQSWPRRDA